MAAQAGKPLAPEQEGMLRLFADTVRFYLRRDVDKSTAEDKHVFRAEELMHIGARHGLHTEFLPNFVFGHFVTHSPDAPAPFDAYLYMKNYLRYCMDFGPAFVEQFDVLFALYVELVRVSSAGWSGPHFHGVFLWQRPIATVPVPGR